MQVTETGSNLTIFFLFSGIAAIEAVRTQNWLYVVFWLAIGALFVLLSRRRKLF
jgi:hypothetical protein